MGKSDMKKCTKLLDVIKKYHDKGMGVHEFDLIDEAGMEISSFNAIKGYFLHKFDEHVKYTKKGKLYEIIVTPVELQKKLDDLFVRD